MYFSSELRAVQRYFFFVICSLYDLRQFIEFICDSCIEISHDIASGHFLHFPAHLRLRPTEDNMRSDSLHHALA
jgi:hypothetical protein